MKKIKLSQMLIKIVCLLFCLLVVFNNYSFAKGGADIIKNITGTAYGSNGTQVVSATTTVMATIIQVVRIVGMGIAIIMLIYVAIKYMSAAPQEKAEFKKQAIAFIVGAIVLFATSAILGLIANFANSNLVTS